MLLTHPAICVWPPPELCAGVAAEVPRDPARGEQGLYAVLPAVKLHSQLRVQCREQAGDGHKGGPIAPDRKRHTQQTTALSNNVTSYGAHTVQKIGAMLGHNHTH
jgi:hypothetical protein